MFHTNTNESTHLLEQDNNDVTADTAAKLAFHQNVIRKIKEIESLVALLPSETPVAYAAGEVLKEMKTLGNPLNKKRVMSLFNAELIDNELLTMMDATISLLKTPYLDEECKVNPDFTARANSYKNTMNNMKSSSVKNKLIGAGLILAAAALIAAFVVACVFTKGLLAPIAFLTLAIAGSTFTAGVSTVLGLGSASFFRSASRTDKVTNLMEPLAKLANRK